jgi:hypothetical protein
MDLAEDMDILMATVVMDMIHSMMIQCFSWADLEIIIMKKISNKENTKNDI